MNKNYSKNGFTLAEVLITLGILGIVIAMTIPAIITKYRKQEISARLKKFYTAMNQAIMMSEIDNGEIKYWQISRDFRAEDGSYDYNKGGANSLKFFNQYLAKYIKYHSLSQGYSKENEDGIIINKYNKIYFYDGSSVQIKQGECVDFIFDINGDKKPNKSAIDNFNFLICPSGHIYQQGKFSTFGNSKTREDALNKCKTENYTCSKLLQIDGWEIKKDYPYKI